jgi:hypothetical protein
LADLDYRAFTICEMQWFSALLAADNLQVTTLLKGDEEKRARMFRTFPLLFAISIG